MFRLVHFNIYLSFLLIVVFILQVGMNTIVFIKFKTIQSYISEEVCVNRNNPASTCFGKCYLKSQLQKSDAKEKQMQSYSKDKVMLFFVHVQLLFDTITVLQQNHYSDLHVLKQVCISLDIFHPPAV